ncbi:hypothetical protein GCM10010207_17090 [Streptomyces atratus]|nr:hypothetical protein GCM10010207_17090 [Streptomyces atratus]
MGRLIRRGTGSGKTESFLVPVLDHCRRARAAGQDGVKAILLYPMNALATDQAQRLNDQLKDPRLAQVSAALYIGDEPATGYAYVETDRARIRGGRPDILITNYKMLDLLLQRAEDVPLWQDEALAYVVVDEFHTYDGAQGTDVAMLMRRLGAATGKVRPGHPLSDVCPVDCATGNSIRFLGRGLAPLAAASVTQLFTGGELAPGPERGTLLFNDSVQDAAHRAGFVANRAYDFSLRALLAAQLDEETARPLENWTSRPGTGTHPGQWADDDFPDPRPRRLHPLRPPHRPQRSPLPPGDACLPRRQGAVRRAPAAGRRVRRPGRGEPARRRRAGGEGARQPRHLGESAGRSGPRAGDGGRGLLPQAVHLPAHAGR